MGYLKVIEKDNWWGYWKLVHWKEEMMVFQMELMKGQMKDTVWVYMMDQNLNERVTIMKNNLLPFFLI